MSNSLIGFRCFIFSPLPAFFFPTRNARQAIKATITSSPNTPPTTPPINGPFDLDFPGVVSVFEFEFESVASGPEATSLWIAAVADPSGVVMFADPEVVGGREEVEDNPTPRGKRRVSLRVWRGG
jgi:hypothetical protein